MRSLARIRLCSSSQRESWRNELKMWEMPLNSLPCLDKKKAFLLLTVSKSCNVFCRSSYSRYDLVIDSFKTYLNFISHFGLVIVHSWFYACSDLVYL